MIVAAFLLAPHVAVPGLPESVVVPAPPPRMRQTTAPQTAIRTFREVCVAHLRDRRAVANAARGAGFRPDRRGRPEAGADSYVRGDTSLQYNSAGLLPVSASQPQCFVRAWLDATVGEGAFERSFAAAIRPGTLRRSRPILVWERDAAGSQTETIGLQMNRLPHGQIVAVLSIALKAQAGGAQ